MIRGSPAVVADKNIALSMMSFRQCVDRGQKTGHFSGQPKGR
jgi:hypothetical protein